MILLWFIIILMGGGLLAWSPWTGAPEEVAAASMSPADRVEPRNEEAPAEPVVDMPTPAEEEPEFEILKVGDDAERTQHARLARLRESRDAALVSERLAALRGAAAEDRNIIPAMLDCARAYCTLYEIRHVLEETYGKYREPVFF